MESSPQLWKHKGFFHSDSVSTAAKNNNQKGSEAIDVALFFYESDTGGCKTNELGEFSQIETVLTRPALMFTRSYWSSYNNLAGYYLELVWF